MESRHDTTQKRGLPGGNPADSGVQPMTEAYYQTIQPDESNGAITMPPMKHGDRREMLPMGGGEPHLAMAYVPVQKSVTPRYDPEKALVVGTLFPGLNLPYQRYTDGKNVANTPLGELQAVGMAVHELGLYLDTHPHDGEALSLRNSYVLIMKDAVRKYEKQYGPISPDSVMEPGGGYPWTESPWPWEAR